jgi:hypothetical protein
MRSRRRKLAVIGLGAALSLLLGTGLFALASDSVTSTGNKARSGTFTSTTAQDLKVARVPFDPTDASTSDCANATYSDGPLTALINPAGNINVSLDTINSDSQNDVLCVKNAGSAAGRIRVVFDNVVETEVGACEASEAAAGDASCQDGQAGELASVLTPGFAEGPNETGLCDPLQTYFSSWQGTGQVLAPHVVPGAFCVWILETHTDLDPVTSPEEQRLRAQTDMVQWDISFTLEEI